jgi:DNA-binding NtrC family response regulator
VQRLPCTNESAHSSGPSPRSAFRICSPTSSLGSRPAARCSALELCRRMRASRHRIEVVLVTAWASVSTTAAAFEAGVRRVFPKPIDFRMLPPLVEEAVGSEEGDGKLG